MQFTLCEARENDLDDVRALMRRYNAFLGALGVDLCFQDFNLELETLPGKYTPPRGEIWLARGGMKTPLGIIAVKPLDESGVC